jgi:hypothetical protein
MKGQNVAKHKPVDEAADKGAFSVSGGRVEATTTTNQPISFKASFISAIEQIDENSCRISLESGASYPVHGKKEDFEAAMDEATGTKKPKSE